MDMDPVDRLGERFPWLDTVEEIAEDQGFFHWELRFAQRLRRGRLRHPGRQPTMGAARVGRECRPRGVRPVVRAGREAAGSEHSARKAELLSTERAA